MSEISDTYPIGSLIQAKAHKLDDILNDKCRFVRFLHELFDKTGRLGGTLIL
jgi:hypothetical protein